MIIGTAASISGNPQTNMLDILNIDGDFGFAFSVRKLRAAYTGKVVKVRRSDNVEGTLAFDGANMLSLNSSLTVTSGSSSATNLGEFAAATGYTDADSKGSGQTVFVVEWYNQYDNTESEKFRNGTSSRQPVLVTSGVLETKNGVTTIKFADAHLTATNFSERMQTQCYVYALNSGNGLGSTNWLHGLAGTSNSYIFITADSNSNSGVQYQYSVDGTSSDQAASVTINGLTGRNNTSQLANFGYFEGNYSNDATRHQYDYTKLYSFIVDYASSGGTNDYPAGALVSIGTWANSSAYHMNGHISEVLFRKRDHDGTDNTGRVSYTTRQRISKNQMQFFEINDNLGGYRGDIVGKENLVLYVDPKKFNDDSHDPTITDHQRLIAEGGSSNFRKGTTTGDAFPAYNSPENDNPASFTFSGLVAGSGETHTRLISSEHQPQPGIDPHTAGVSSGDDQNAPRLKKLTRFCWFNVDSFFVSGGLSGVASLLFGNTYGNQAKFGALMVTSSDDSDSSLRQKLEYRDHHNHRLRSSTTLQTNQWYLGAVSVNFDDDTPSRHATLYLDGEPVGEQGIGADLSVSANLIVSSSNQQTVGAPSSRATSAATARPFNGKIGIFGLYDTDFDSPRMRTIFNQLKDQYNYESYYIDQAFAAYSTRKVVSTYTGFALKGRRSSDSDEVNISFDSNGKVSGDSAITVTSGDYSGTMTLSAFGGSADVHVTTWYDQGSNGSNVTQSTASRQPKIWSNGLVTTSAGHAALDFDGSDDRLVASGAVMDSTMTGLFMYVESDSNTYSGSGAFPWISQYDGGTAGRFAFGYSVAQKCINLFHNGTDSLILNDEDFDTGNDEILNPTLAGIGKPSGTSGTAELYLGDTEDRTSIGTVTDAFNDSNVTGGIAQIDFSINSNKRSFENSVDGQCAEVIILANGDTSESEHIFKRINKYYELFNI